MNQDTCPETTSPWIQLYKITGIVLITLLASYPFQIIIFMISRPPITVLGWFSLIQTKRLIGLSFDFLFLLQNLPFLLVLLALYVTLRRINESVMVIAISLGLIGIVTLIVARPIFEMISLSDQYTAATNEIQRTMLLAAGQALMELRSGTAFDVSYIVGVVAMILNCMVMLQCKIFSSATAYVGLLANVIGLGYFIPTIGIYVAIFSVILLWIWYILLAKRFFALAKSKSNAI
jgi:hypothetical protein